MRALLSADMEREAPSRLSGLDPRTRIVAALAVACAVVALAHPVSAGVAVLAALALAAASGVGLAALARRLAHMEGFMLVLLVMLPFSTPGVPLWEAGVFSPTREGVARALLIVLKVNACAIALFALVGTLEPVRLGQAAARLGVPERLVHVFLFMVRYLALIRAEAARLSDAMRARGFAPRANLHTWRSLGRMCGMLLVRALERADRVFDAMRCRGFDGRLPAPFSPFAFGRADAAFGLVLALVIGAGLVLDRLP